VLSSGPCPKPGPSPTILSRIEVDALYETLTAVVAAFAALDVPYIVTGGSLLGSIRQHSILFCDDDVDVAVVDDGDTGDGPYARVRQSLGTELGDAYAYVVRPWEGGDRVRHRRVNSVFVDIFVLRRFATLKDLQDLVGTKRNGMPQSEKYVENIVNTVRESAVSQGEEVPLCPFWHFNERKAVELWPREVYREHELFPLSTDLKFGPLMSIQGPRMPVLLLKRAFGKDCFEVYYQSLSHGSTKKTPKCSSLDERGDLPPLLQGGGTWDTSQKMALRDEHYLPMQPVSRSRRRFTLHDRDRLFAYLAEQTRREAAYSHRPRRTVYMDGVFDLFHTGHLQAIQQCVELGDRVVVGVTGDEDAKGYKRPPIVDEEGRAAIVRAIRGVDRVVCPCPLYVTKDFMEKEGIDLVVHGFADEADAKRQEEDFFSVPIKFGKFQRIDYHHVISTTDIINKIRSLPL